MHARQGRFLVAIFTVGLVLPLLAAPVTAATCTLTAPPTVPVGAQLTIVGSGFPASTSVDISLTREGSSPDQFTAQSDAAGGFLINLTTEAADEGTTTVVATAGAGCTAEVTYTVGSAAVASGPSVTPPAALPPTTDAVADLAGWTSTERPTAWIVAFLLLALGAGGLIVTRPARGR